MLCSRCGHEASYSATFCPACGIRLAAGAPGARPVQGRTSGRPASSGDHAELAATVASTDLFEAPVTGALNGRSRTRGESATSFEPDLTTFEPAAYPAHTGSHESEAGSHESALTTLEPRRSPSTSRADGPGPRGGEASVPRSSQDSGPLDVGENFGSRYHIISLLGIGGMGAVYRAWDAELGVAVAIKVIRPEVMADPEAAADVERRFKRELLLARQVTHKNVVRIHDIGEIRGIKYITMSYVDGTDLATLIKREGRLPTGEVLRIARAAAAGLAAAHHAGVVHRDLKPANIMIGPGGDALIMDFGIARSTGGPEPDPRATPGVPGAFDRAPARYLDATVVGVVIGTVEYMAPEQARGEAVDGRADIYAFGLILYDLLLGRRRAEHAESAVADLQRRLQQPPPPVSTLVPGVSRALDTVVARCVEPDPLKRYQTTDELARDLDRIDDRGELIRTRRVVGLPLMAATILMILAIAGIGWWYVRPGGPAAAHEPVSVLIADVDNRSGDATFDRTLEPMLRLALEEAGFITAIDRPLVRSRLSVQPPPRLDERAAREIAVQQGVGIVLAASIAPSGGGFDIAVRASESVTGKTVMDVHDRAPAREQVLPVAARLATDVREALGDDTSDTSRRFAMDTLSATSLNVVRAYARAMEAQADGRFDASMENFTEALSGDPNFGLAYAGMASSSWNLGRKQDAEMYAKEAVRHLDRMTERERYRARGLAYMATGDYSQCLKEFGDMIGRYSADTVALNNLAYCYSQIRDMHKAAESMRRVSAILPKRALYRLNLALYSAYGSQFEDALEAVQVTEQLGHPLSRLPLAFANLGQGKVREATAAYEALGKTNAQGASFAASGLADIAIYEGRYSDAVQILERAAAADLEAKFADRAAAKYTALGYAEISRRRPAAAIAAAGKALANNESARVRFLAARIFVDAGEIDKARTIAAALGRELQAEPQAYAKIIDGQIALTRAVRQAGDPRDAIKRFTEANALLDTWTGRFYLGRAYLAAGMFLQADSEFDRCMGRRGELFLDEDPRYGQLPLVYYYQGQAREGLNSAGFAELYRTYLDIRDKTGEDPLLPDARARYRIATQSPQTR